MIILLNIKAFIYTKEIKLNCKKISLHIRLTVTWQKKLVIATKIATNKNWFCFLELCCQQNIVTSIYYPKIVSKNYVDKWKCSQRQVINVTCWDITSHKCRDIELERHKLKERNWSQKNTWSFDLSVHAWTGKQMCHL
jgi:hypothetical protein